MYPNIDASIIHNDGKKALVSMKSRGFIAIETGYVYAPYVPSVMIPTIFDLPDQFEEMEQMCLF